MKRSTRTSGWMAVVFGILVLGALLACKKKREPLSFTPNPKTAVGRYYKLTVESAKECDVGKEYLEPQKGFVHVGIEAIFEATTEERVAVHSHELRVNDQSGRSYRTSLGQCEPELENMRYVEKGERLRGLITFAVPESTSSLEFVDSNMVSPAKGMDEVRIVLSR